MADDDIFKIDQFTKELVFFQVQGVADPGAVAAAMVQKTALLPLTSRPEEAKRVISDACYGGLQGLLLAGHDLTRAAALILGAIEGLAPPLGLDRSAVKGYALDGFARMRHLLTQDQLVAMRDALESRFSGSGAAFAASLAKQPDPRPRANAELTIANPAASLKCDEGPFV